MDRGKKTEEGSNEGAGSADAPATPAKEESEKDDTDLEIEEMKKKLKELEERASRESSEDVDSKGKPVPASGPDVDSRSIYVGNVDYSTKPEELQEYFQACGVVNRITILCDKTTGHPKGFAYIEFKEVESAQNALLLNETEFKGRPLKISLKRTNVPGLARGRGRGRGGRGRGRGGFPAVGYYPPAAFAGYPPVVPYMGGYGRPRFRNRRAVFTPY